MKAKTFNVSFPADLLKKVDAAAEREYRSRSEFIREAARQRIENAEWELHEKKLQRGTISTGVIDEASKRAKRR